jgi:hypothetical protein
MSTSGIETQGPEARFPPLNPAVPFPITVPVQPNPGTLLPDEFENLKRSVQLLRISQLRYVVQKFSLPANGNKTRLLKVVLQLFEAMRHAQLLCQINNEVMALLSQQHEPFSSPLDSMHRLSVIRTDMAPLPSPHPFVKYSDNPPICGPILAPVGSSFGNFGFIVQDPSGRYALDFSWDNNVKSALHLAGEINGYSISVLPDDPNPGPIDISAFLVRAGQMNLLDLSLVKTQVSVIICIREYTPVTLTQIANKIVKVDSPDYFHDLIAAKGPRCNHPETFQLAGVIVRGIVNGRCECPICHDSFSIDQLVLVSYTPGGRDPDAVQDWTTYLL